MILKKFLETYLKIVPRTHANYYKSFENTRKLILHHPIQASKSTSNLTSIIAKQTIPTHNMVFQLNAEESFNSSLLAGAKKIEVNQIQEKMNEMIAVSQVMQSQEMQGIVRIIVQIWANSLEISSGEMPLKQFAYILGQGSDSPVNDLTKYETVINSPHLFNMYQSNNALLKTFHQLLTQKVIRYDLSEDDFHKIFLNIRNFSRRVKDPLNPSQNFSDFVSPFIPSIRQSYNPNCEIKGKYFTHLKSSFYCIQTTKQIKAGEELLLPYRQNLSFYDLLFRYGRLQEEALVNQEGNEKNQEIIIIADLMQDAHSFIDIGDIQKKQELLLESKLKMKNSIKLRRNGIINPEDLKMLRILYTGSQEGPQSKIKDTHIHSFIATASENMLNYIKLSPISHSKPINFNPEEPVLKSIKRIQAIEIKVLEEFINRHKK